MPSKYFIPKEMHINYKAEILQGEFHCDDCDERVNEAQWFKDAPADAHALAWQCSKGHITRKYANEVIGL